MKFFVCFCPLGSDCKKGNKRLGKHKLEDEARQQIHHHLVHSTFHSLTDADAAELAEKAEIIEEDWDDAAAAPAGSVDTGKGGSGSGKGDGKHHASSSSWWEGDWKQQSWSSSDRPGPYQVAVPKFATDRGIGATCLSSMARAEAAARTAARMARAAATAFEQEADVLNMEMQKVKAAMQP